MNTAFHIPGRPTRPEPAELAKISSDFRHPNIVRSGVTTTKDGTWAILLVVKQGTKTPIEGISSKTYPIVYQQETGRMAVARPAYPNLGE